MDREKKINDLHLRLKTAQAAGDSDLIDDLALELARLLDEKTHYPGIYQPPFRARINTQCLRRTL